MVETKRMDWADPARSHVKDAAEKRKNIKAGLYLPSYSCNDLDRALKCGVITKKTFLIIVEGHRDLAIRKKNLKAIKAFLTLNKLNNVYIHSSRIHTLNLKKALNGRKLELCFFDICGNYTAENANWFHKYQDCFAHNMMLPMTLAIHPRGNRDKKDKDKSKFYATVDKVATKSLRDLSLANIPNEILGCEDMNSENLLQDIRITLKAIYHSFSRREVKFKYIKPYKFSKTNMVRLDIMIGKDKAVDETFEEIAIQYSPKVSSQKRIRKTSKPKKSIYTVKPTLLKTAYDIARHMRLFGKVESIYDLPRGRLAHISINAKKAGLNPDDVKDKIEKRLQKDGLAAA